MDSWPFSSPPIPHLRVSPLGVVAKKSLSYHLSHLARVSVNNDTAAELTSMLYISFDGVVAVVC